MPYVYSHQALSSEGRMARSLQVKGVPVEDRNRWVQIQTSTFNNWVNEQLGKRQLKSEDLIRDVHDGILLVELVEVLRNQKCPGKLYKNDPTEIQMLMNVQMALDALLDDGVKLVNIGSYDIVEGNVKLVLGLVWCLILRYQIASKTKIPPKKLMMAWCKAVMPHLSIRNFSTDWNDGIALSNLVEYCRPGTIPNIGSLSPKDGAENCRRAVELAHEHLGVPMILSPDDLNSDQLDELSCMTYLSYFIRPGAPGYKATLAHVRQLVPDITVGNFKSDWNDGQVLCQLVVNLGGRIPGWPHISHDPAFWARNINHAMNAGRVLGVTPLISAEDMADPDVDTLAVMAYVAHLCALPAQEAPSEQPSCRIEPVRHKQIHVNQQVNVDLTFIDPTVRLSDLRCELGGGSGVHARQQQFQRTVKGASLAFVPTVVGNYAVGCLRLQSGFSNVFRYKLVCIYVEKCFLTVVNIAVVLIIKKI